MPFYRRFKPRYGKRKVYSKYRKYTKKPRMGVIGRRLGFTDGFKKVWGMAESALRMANNVKKLINVEFKSKSEIHPINGALSNSVSSPHTFTPNVIRKGDDSDQRNGNKILLKSWKLSFRIQWNPAGASVQQARYFIINVPSNENAGVDMSKYLVGTAFDSLRNLDYVKEFRTLRSGIVKVDTTKNSIPLHFNLPLNFHTQYNADAGDVTDITSGALQLIMFGDQASNGPVCYEMQSRIYYIDN